MKSINKLIAAFAILCVALSACQKDFTIDDELDPVDPPASGDSIYLHMVYDLYDEGSGIDTQAISRIVYDSRKRVIAIVDSSMDASIGNDSLIYFYNGNDTVPSKMIDKTLSDPSYGIAYEVSFFYYDAQLRKTKDSAVYVFTDTFGESDTSITVVKYSYGTNRIYGETWSNNFVSTTIELVEKDTAITNAAGDIVSSKRYNIIAGIAELTSSAAFTYDNHPSPFSKLSLISAHRQLPNGETILGEYMSFQNIITQLETYADGSNSYSADYTYEYNSKGFPKKVISDAGTADEGIIYYTYRAL